MSVSSLSSSLRAPSRCVFALLLGAAASLTACASPDPEASMADFVERTTVPDAGADVTADATVDVDPDAEVCAIDSPAGRYLLSLIVTPLDRQQLSPLMVDLTIAPEDDGQYTFNFQPIATDFILVDQQRQPRVAQGNPGEEGYSPAPREAVGAAITVNDIAIDEAGAFVVSVDEIRVVGFANALTFRDILADLTLTGSLRSNDVGCGDVSGTGKEPIPNLNLNTSVFGMIRVDDPQAYTDPIVISCASPQAVEADPCDGQTTPEGSGEGSGE
jgi:hypothetical protein